MRTACFRFGTLVDGVIALERVLLEITELCTLYFIIEVLLVVSFGTLRCRFPRI